MNGIKALDDLRGWMRDGNPDTGDAADEIRELMEGGI